MPSFGFVRIDEMLVQNVVEQADRYCHQCDIQVVVAASEIFQQGNATNVQQVGERGDHQESEEQFVVLVLEHQNAVCLEVEQDADDCGQEIGDDVGVVDLEQVLKNE